MKMPKAAAPPVPTGIVAVTVLVAVVHRCNQPGELIDADTVLRDITTYDLRNQAGINLLRSAVVGHIFCPNVVDWVLEPGAFAISVYANISNWAALLSSEQTKTFGNATDPCSVNGIRFA
jgi:hypothetical protein